MKKLLPQFWMCMLLLALSPALIAQTLDPSFAALSLYRIGTVEAAAQQPDGKIVISGSFIRINGTTATSIARLNADGSLDQAFTSTVAAQSSAVTLSMLSNGQIVAFSPNPLVIAGQSYRGLVKLNPDGTVVSGFSVGSGTGGGIARAMTVQPDGKILLAGSFTSYNGTAAPGLVRLNADGSVDQAFTSALGTGFTSDIYVLRVQADGKVLVGGRFTDFNGSGRRYLVRLESTGSLDTSYNPVTTNNNGLGVVHMGLDPVTGQAVVVGLGQNLTYFFPMRLNTNGTVDASFQPFTNFTSNCLSTSLYNNTQLLVDSNRRVLLAKGCDPSGGGNSITRYTPSGAVDNDFAAESNGPANVVLQLASGQMLLGGSFTRFNGVSNVNLIQVNDFAVPSVSFRPLIDEVGTVSKVLRQPDGKLLVSGLFREVNGQAATNMLRLDADGTLDSSFGLPLFNGSVNAMALQPDGKIVVGGSFSVAAGVNAPMVARLLPSGAFDPAFQVLATPSLSYSIRALAVQPDGSILVGSASSVNIGGRIATLHRLLPTGQIDVAYGLTIGTVSNSVNDIVVLPDGRHYVAGSFPTFSGVPAEGLVRVMPSGSLDPTFALPATSTSTPQLYKVIVDDNGQVVVGGSFSSFRGLPRTNLARLNANGQIDPMLNGSIGGLIVPLYVQADGKIIIGTYANSIHVVAGVNKGSLSRLNADGTLDNTFAASPSLVTGSVPTAVVQPDGKLVIGGIFSTVSGQTQMGVARLLVPNVLGTTAAQVAAGTEVWPVPAHSTLHVRMATATHPQHLTLLDALGRVVRVQPATAAAEQLFSVEQVPAGVYLLRIDYAEGTVSRRVVVQ